MVSYLNWLENEAAYLGATSPTLAVEFTRSPTNRSKPGAWLDVSSGRRVGQVIVWSSGECDTAIADAETNVTATYQLDGQDHLRRIVRDVVEACIGGRPL